MDEDVKQEFNCCVGCLKDDTNVRRIVNEDILRIYQRLMLEQMNQLDLTTFELCDDCTQTLENIDTFRKQCLNSIEILSGRLPFNFVSVKVEKEDEIVIKKEEFPESDNENRSNTPDFPSDNENTDEETLKPPVPQLRYKKTATTNCKICGESCYLQFLTKHLKTIHMMRIEKSDKYKCNICDEICSHSIIPHFNKHANYNEPKECKACGKFFKNRIEYRKHVDTHNNTNRNTKTKKLYPCDCCDATYATSRNLTFHMMRVHQGAMKCKYCMNAYFDKAEFEKHMKIEEDKINARRMHGQQLYKNSAFTCDLCKKQYKSKDCLKFHFKISHTISSATFECEECHKTFTQKKYLTKHKKRIGLKHICDFCGYETAWKAQIYRHMMKHHNSSHRDIICHDCGKPYFNKSQFMAHQKAAHLEKRYQCTECGKKLATATSLKKHINSIHKSDKYGKCSVCYKIVKTEYMRRHIRQVHKDTREHECDFCDLCFKTKRTLNQHMMYIHSNTRPYCCSMCSAGFYSGKQLMAHFQRDHDVIYTQAEVRKICGKKERK